MHFYYNFLTALEPTTLWPFFNWWLIFEPKEDNDEKWWSRLVVTLLYGYKQGYTRRRRGCQASFSTWPQNNSKQKIQNPKLRQMFNFFFSKLTNHVIKDCHKQIVVENELVKNGKTNSTFACCNFIFSCCTWHQLLYW